MKTFDQLTEEYNFKSSQADLLLNLCDNNLTLLESLFFALKNDLRLQVPCNKVELTLTLLHLPFKAWDDQHNKDLLKSNTNF